MRKKPLLVVLLVLSLLGIGDSWYLASKALFGGELACSIKGLDGCNQVAQSVYSHLFGIPLGVYGLLFYGLLFVLVITAFFVSTRLLRRGLAGLGALGLVASIIFEGIQIFLIKAICVYCLGSAIICLFVFILTVLLWRTKAGSQQGALVKEKAA